MCFCSLGNILDVEVFGTVDQKDVVAAGTVRKSGSCPGKESVSAVSHPSSVISPGPRVSDPMLEGGDGRCAGDIPPSPGCAALRQHEHTPGGAVAPGTVSLPEVTKRPPRYMVAEVFSLLMRGFLPGLIHCDQSCHIPGKSWEWALMASQRIHQRWPGVPKIFQQVWSAAPQGWNTRRCFCVRKNFLPKRGKHC